MEMRKSVTITLTLSEDLARKLDRICKQEDLNRSQLVRRTVRAYQLAQEAQSDPPRPKS
jgi:metal-responsive CopG/Arc/MetJ family transcriptional regulator